MWRSKSAIDSINLSAPGGDRVDVVAMVDALPLGRYQWEIFGLCFLIAMLEGFDTQAIAFVAPGIATEWKIPASAFGPVFSSGLLGSVLGMATLGRLSDRYGRRLITIATVTLFGAATLASARAESLTGLIAYRLVAGVGLGGAMPNFMALVAEYAPRRIRATVVVMTVWGYPLGGIFGGLASTWLMSRFGWRSVLEVGGVGPILLVPLLLIRLPESLRFLVRRPSGQESARRILSRMVRGARFESRLLTVSEVAGCTGSYRTLFAPPFAANTILFGLAMFMGLLLSYLLVNWIPLLLHESGMSLKDAVFGTVTFNFAGIVGSYFLSRRVDDGTRPLGMMAAAYCAAAVSLVLIGGIGTRFWPVILAIFAAGFLLIGAQMTTMAFVASSYPTAVRATALGWLHAVGRCGSMVGPLVAGSLLSVGMLPARLFQVSSIAALIAAGALAVLSRVSARRGQTWSVQ